MRAVVQQMRGRRAPWKVTTLVASLLVNDVAARADDPTVTSGACVAEMPAMTVVPGASGPVAPQTTVVYTVTVTNNDQGDCNGRSFLFLKGAAPPEVSSFVAPTRALVAPGASARFALAVTATTSAAPGVYRLPLSVLDVTSQARLDAEVEYDLAPASGCFVRPDRELLVRDLSVVEDAVRTSPGGAWTFGALMARLAPPATAPAALVEELLRTWLTDQTINGLRVAARPSMAPFLLARWPRAADGSLDLARSPLRLLAIVNRLDQRSLPGGRAAQARFVFGVLDPIGGPAPFTVILEYELPAAEPRDVFAWAHAWHRLGALPFPSDEYNAALERLTERFTDPRGPRGRFATIVRTNEAALDLIWEMRQFRLSRASGLLEPVPVTETPDSRFMEDTAPVADFVNAESAAIRAGRYMVPLVFEGAPFRGGSSLNSLGAWIAPGIVDPEARHLFSLNTCNGCHGASETGTEFLHVGPRAEGSMAGLSGFLQGIALADAVTGELRTFNDLQRRKADLEGLVCAGGGNVFEEIHRAH
jgi:hypothetical protein